MSARRPKLTAPPLYRPALAVAQLVRTLDPTARLVRATNVVDERLQRRAERLCDTPNPGRRQRLELRLIYWLTEEHKRAPASIAPFCPLRTCDPTLRAVSPVSRSRNPGHLEESTATGPATAQRPGPLARVGNPASPVRKEGQAIRRQSVAPATHNRQYSSRIAPAQWSGKVRAVAKPADIRFGLYRVFWKSGGSSMAAIGGDASGGRWIAPSNWIAPASLDAERLNSIACLEGPVEWDGAPA